jgi:hypothetical protein
VAVVFTCLGVNPVRYGETQTRGFLISFTSIYNALNPHLNYFMWLQNLHLASHLCLTS